MIRFFLQDPVMYTTQHEDENIGQIFVDPLEENNEKIFVRFDKLKKMIFRVEGNGQFKKCNEVLDLQ